MNAPTRSSITPTPVIDQAVVYFIADRPELLEAAGVQNKKLYGIQLCDGCLILYDYGGSACALLPVPP